MFRDGLAKQAFRDELMARFHSIDLDSFPHWISMYECLLAVTKSIRPQRVIEIGCRAGYSSWTFFQCPTVRRVLAIDFDGDERTVGTHGGRKGLHNHARWINAGLDFEMLIVDSHRIEQLPACDLVYVDGDHSAEGCYQDLCLAAKSANILLVDDYSSIPDVRAAVTRFVNERRASGTFHENGSTGLFQIDL